MELLSEIKINRSSGDAVIQLFHGDMSAIPPEHAVDIMIVSAYPNNYDPLPGTLIGALYNKGLNFANLAQHKQVDLTTQLGCWLSYELPVQLQQQFKTFCKFRTKDIKPQTGRSGFQCFSLPQ